MIRPMAFRAGNTRRRPRADRWRLTAPLWVVLSVFLGAGPAVHHIAEAWFFHSTHVHAIADVQDTSPARSHAVGTDHEPATAPPCLICQFAHTLTLACAPASPRCVLSAWVFADPVRDFRLHVSTPWLVSRSRAPPVVI